MAALLGEWSEACAVTRLWDLQSCLVGDLGAGIKGRGCRPCRFGGLKPFLILICFVQFSSRI